MRIREYKVDKRNSSVNGNPGRYFDWSKFDWEGKSSYDYGAIRGMDGKPLRILKAPKPWTDNCLIEENCQYLHVPYAYEEQGTIYRVRPNESMRAGQVYRGHGIKRQSAVKKADGWYWRLEAEELPKANPDSPLAQPSSDLVKRK